MKQILLIIAALLLTSCEQDRVIQVKILQSHPSTPGFNGREAYTTVQGLADGHCYYVRGEWGNPGEVRGFSSDVLYNP